MSSISVPHFPTKVEFRLQLDVMVAVFKRDPEMCIGYAQNGHAYVRPHGVPVPLPPEDFTYTPPGLRTPIPTSTEGDYVGWTLCAIATSMHNNGLKTNWSPPNDGTPLNEPLSEAQLDHESTWTVILGPQDIRECQEPEYDWVCVRIASPVFTQAENSLDVKRDLQKTLQVLDQEYITFTHGKSRLQVLVKPAGSGFSLSGLKKIASLLWVADPLLSKVHPPHCGPGSLSSLGLQFTRLADYQDEIDLTVQRTSADFLENPWNNRLAGGLQPLMMLPHPGELSEVQFGHGTHKLRRVQEHLELANLLDIVPIHHGNDTFLKSQGPFGPAYDFQDFKHNAERAMLGFNQHCGTLDLEAILHWAAVCTRIVAFSMEQSSNAFNEVLLTLRHSIRSRNGSLTGFLYRLGLPLTADYYESRDSELQIPDFKYWPILRKPIPDDDSEPSVGAQMAVLQNSEEMLTEDPQQREQTQRQFLRLSGESMSLWHDPSTTNNPDSRYTFGIELEMLMPIISPRVFPNSWDGAINDSSQADVDRDPQPEDNRKCAHAEDESRAGQLVELLQGLGYAASSGIDPWDEYFQEPNGRKDLRDQNMLHLKQYPIDFQSWKITNDTSLTTCQEWKGYNELIGIEFSSPIYRDKPECWEAILTIMSALRSNMRIALDDSCGFHVSVGTGDSPMEFHFFRKLASLMFVADRLIFSLCDPRRKMVNSYCRPLREESALTNHLCDEWKDLPLTLDFAQCFPIDELSAEECAILKKLWTITNIPELRNYLCSSRGGRSSVSFNRVEALRHLDPFPKYYSGAAEFRYLQGTLDPELVIRFSQLMVSIFKFAHTAEPEAWRRLTSVLLKCKDTWDYDFGILKDVLQQLGMSDHYGYWEEVAKENRSGVPEVREKLENDWFNLRSWRPEELEEYLESIKIVPELPQSTFTSIQRDLCRSAKYTAYAKEKLGDVLPRAITIDTQADLHNRVKALFESIELDKNAAEKIVQDLMTAGKKVEDITESYLKEKLVALTDANKAPSSTISEGFDMQQAISHCAETYNSSGIEGVLGALNRYGKDLKAGEDTEVSRQEMNTFLGLEDSHESNSAFIFESFSRCEGKPLEITISEEEWKQFLS